MICKLSGRDNTLATVHAKMKVMAGRNFLGSAIARMEWMSGPVLAGPLRRVEARTDDGGPRDRFAPCGHGQGWH